MRGDMAWGEELDAASDVASGSVVMSHDRSPHGTGVPRDGGEHASITQARTDDGSSARNTPVLLRAILPVHS